MNSLTFVLAGCLSFGSIMLPAQAFDVPAACAAIDPREQAFANPYRMSSRAIATAQEQYQLGQAEAAAQTLDALVASLQELDADTVEPADQILDAYFQLQLAEVYLEIQHPEPAFLLLESALEQSLQPRYLSPFQIVLRAAELYARAGAFKQAWTLMNTPLGPGRDVDANWDAGRASVALNTALFHLDNDDVKQAEAVIKTIDPIYPQYAEGEMALVEHLIAQGDLSLAESLARSIKPVEYYTLNPMEHRWIALVKVSRAYAAAQQPQLAQQILDLVTVEMQNDFNSTVLLAMADVYIELNDVNQAQKLFTRVRQRDYMQEPEDRLEQLDPQWYRTEATIQGYYNNTLSALLWEHRHALLNIAKQYWRLGEIEQYHQTLADVLSPHIVDDQLREASESTNVQSAIVDFLLETGQLELAVQLAKSYESGWPGRNLLLIRIVEASLAQENYQQALSAAYALEDSEFVRWSRSSMARELLLLETLLEQDKYGQASARIASWSERFSWANDLEIKPEHWIEFVRCHESQSNDFLPK